MIWDQILTWSIWLLLFNIHFWLVHRTEVQYRAIGYAEGNVEVLEGKGAGEEVHKILVCRGQNRETAWWVDNPKLGIRILEHQKRERGT